MQVVPERTRRAVEPEGGGAECIVLYVTGVFVMV